MVNQKEMENIFGRMVHNIGQFKNGLMHGKGTLYYTNGKIMYEVD